MSDPSVSSRVAVSFTAAFVGWGVTFLTWVAYRELLELRAPADFNGVLWWTLGFTAVGWLVFAVPFVAWIRPDSWLVRFPFAPVTGIGLSFAAYMVVIGWHTVLAWQPDVFAASVGLLATLVYVALTSLMRSAVPRVRSWLSALWCATPVLTMVAFMWVLWPVMEHAAPETAYRLGTGESRRRVVCGVLKSVRVGTRFEELNRALPREFEQPFGERIYRCGDKLYYIEMVEGVIEDVSVEGAFGESTRLGPR